MADDLNPLRVLQLFQAVSDLDCQLLDLRGRPEDLVMTVLPVPPLSIRPSVEMDAGAGSNEEDITVIVKARPCLLGAVAAVHTAHTRNTQQLSPLPTECNPWHSAMFRDVVKACIVLTAIAVNNTDISHGCPRLKMPDCIAVYVVRDVFKGCLACSALLQPCTRPQHIGKFRSRMLNCNRSDLHVRLADDHMNASG